MKSRWQTRSSPPSDKRREQCVQLRELLGQPLGATDVAVERFLCRVQLGERQVRLAVLLLERDGGHGAVVTFLVRPGQARRRRYLDVLAEEGHRLRVAEVEHQAVA